MGEARCQHGVEGDKQKERGRQAARGGERALPAGARRSPVCSCTLAVPPVRPGGSSGPAALAKVGGTDFGLEMRMHD